MKKTYIIPILEVAYITEELPIALSKNRISDAGDGVEIDPSTMGGGDGGDAVKSNDVYNVWDDDWSR